MNGPTLAAAIAEARRIARKDRVPMVVTESPNDHTGEPEYGWCPARAFELLHGPLARIGAAQIVKQVNP